MVYVAVISVSTNPKIPYFPELRRVSFTAGHNVPHDTEYTSLCVLANDGPAAISNVRVTTAIRPMSMFLLSQT